jgi:copper chaperone
MQLLVPSMVCDGCVSVVKTAILGVDPAATVQINLATKAVSVDTQIEADVVKQAITAAGHTLG